MFDLIKLERKKFKLKFISLGTIISIVSILLLMIAIMFIGQEEADPMCKNIDEYIVTICLFSCLVFIIYGGTMLAKLVISEYEKKTIQVMFMYPIDRKKLLLSKLILVYMFTVINVAICIFVLIGGVAFVEHFMDTVPGNFAFDNVMAGMPIILASIFSSGFLAIAPLFFGMIKKSQVHTIVAAVILASITASGSGDISSKVQLAKIVVMGVVAFISFMLTVTHTLNNIDIVHKA